MSVQIEELVSAGIYPDEAAAVAEALRLLWQERPAIRIAVAVHRYQTEEMSIAKAAAVAGVAFDRMKEILAQQGVTLRLGPETIDEAREEMESLERMLRE